jgi:hypothetical protein
MLLNHADSAVVVYLELTLATGLVTSLKMDRLTNSQTGWNLMVPLVEEILAVQFTTPLGMLSVLFVRRIFIQQLSVFKPVV